jgi:hypothetical protein
VKVATEKPPQPQRVVCPVCDEPHEVLLPSIVKIEVL